MLTNMNNVVKATHISKVFDRPIPVQPLGNGSFRIEGVLYELHELAALTGMTPAAVKRYHTKKLTMHYLEGEDVSASWR
jgi:hypothetical protein